MNLRLSIFFSQIYIHTNIDCFTIKWNVMHQHFSLHLGSFMNISILCLHLFFFPFRRERNFTEALPNGGCSLKCCQSALCWAALTASTKTHSSPSSDRKGEGGWICPVWTGGRVTCLYNGLICEPGKYSLKNFSSTSVCFCCMI